MLFIFSTPDLIRHLWELKKVAYLHWCLIQAVLLTSLFCFGFNKISFFTPFLIFDFFHFGVIKDWLLKWMVSSSFWFLLCFVNNAGFGFIFVTILIFVWDFVSHFDVTKIGCENKMVWYSSGFSCILLISVSVLVSFLPWFWFQSWFYLHRRCARILVVKINGLISSRVTCILFH